MELNQKTRPNCPLNWHYLTRLFFFFQQFTRVLIPPPAKQSLKLGFQNEEVIYTERDKKQRRSHLFHFQAMRTWKTKGCHGGDGWLRWVDWKPRRSIDLQTPSPGAAPCSLLRCYVHFHMVHREPRATTQEALFEVCWTRSELYRRKICGIYFGLMQNSFVSSPNSFRW